MLINPPILLLDTNVWLDICLPHRPNSAAAMNLLFAADIIGASLTYPSQALLDVYQKVRSDNKRWIRESRELTQNDAVAIKRLAWDYINMIQRVATAVPVDSNDIALACAFRDNHDDLEDDLVLAACQRAHANYLVTNDLSLAKHAPIETKTPAEMTALLQSGRAKGTPTSHESANTTDWLYLWLSKYDSTC